MGGILMLSLSLCLDGLTGAQEDKLVDNVNVEAFDLMYNVQVGKALISFFVVMASNQLWRFDDLIYEGGWVLVALGITGAVGQIFIFLTISKFGAFNCALIGLVRKILSLFLSFIVYHHSLTILQALGLTLASLGMVANFSALHRSTT